MVVMSCKAYEKRAQHVVAPPPTLEVNTQQSQIQAGTASALLPRCPRLQVRAAIASQLHLVAAQVARSDAARLLRRPLAALLRDGCAGVRAALLAGMADTLQVCVCVCVCACVVVFAGAAARAR
jgi:hypothetical protein